MDPPRASGEGGGRFRQEPHPALRPFVVEYWAISRDLGAMGGFTITPDCFGELICCADDLDAVVGDSPVRLPRCVFVGLLREPLRVESAGVFRGMSARLRPWAVGRFLETRDARSDRPWKDAASVFGPRLAGVVEGVGRRDWPSLVPVFDRVLIEEFARWGKDASASAIVGPFVGPGRVPTASVAEDRETSTRQVERRVRLLTGTSPKQLAGLSRFQTARDAIWADPAVDLARLAIVAGYSDQAHLTREFRRYSGQTPARFARDSAQRKSWLAALDVAIVQERPGAAG